MTNTIEVLSESDQPDHEDVKHVKDFPYAKSANLYDPETIVWLPDQARQLSYVHPRKEFLYIDGESSDQRIYSIVSIPESNP